VKPLPAEMFIVSLNLRDALDELLMLGTMAARCKQAPKKASPPRPLAPSVTHDYEE